MQPTDEEITRALHEHANPVGDDRWYFRSECISLSHAHTEVEARTIVRLCLTLDQPITDIFTSALFAALMDRILIAEERIARLEEHVTRHRSAAREGRTPH